MMAEGERSYQNALNLAFPVPKIAKHSTQGCKIKNKCDQAKRLQPQNRRTYAHSVLICSHLHEIKSFSMTITYVKQA